MVAKKAKKDKNRSGLAPEKSNGLSPWQWLVALGILLFAAWGFSQWYQRTGGKISGNPYWAPTTQETTSPHFLEDIQHQGLIIDVHEHIESLEVAPIYVEAMDALGIAKMCLMGSSKFTLTMNESYGFTGYDENNEELIKIVEAYPGRFEAWPTMSPADPENLDKFKALAARGATGIKLYTGHGYVTKAGDFMFHPVALDDPNMLPVYEYCQENFIPICLHINPYDDGSVKGKPGFAEEFVAVLTQFPDLKVDAPHFILSSIRSDRFREFLDTFPNLYSNISFGDSFMAERLKYISKYPERFRQLFLDYPDRFMFAADLVLDEAAVRINRKTPEWVRAQIQSYLDMLTKETYESPFVLDKATGQPEILNGLALPDELVARVLYKNYEALRESKPKGTRLNGTFDWSHTGVYRSGRTPGQSFPPRKEPVPFLNN